MRMNIANFRQIIRYLSNPKPLPSLKKIEQMEQQRQQAIDALEISGNSVKCQRCGSAIPLGPKYIKAFCNDRIGILERRIIWLEKHDKYTRDEEIKAIKAELAELQEEDIYIGGSLYYCTSY
jgi:hypothetical protein